jgi:phosphohistidine phosphatase
VGLRRREGVLGVESLMKTLYLLRHAKSDWDDPKLSDHERPLSARGRHAAETMANYWRARKGGPPPVDLVLCSTAARARQTWDIVSRCWPADQGPPVLIEEGLYLCGEEGLLDRLHRLEERVETVLMVGHNPGFQILARDLCSYRDGRLWMEASNKLPTGSLVEIKLPSALAWSSLTWGKAHLSDFIRPRDFQGAAWGMA